MRRAHNAANQYPSYDNGVPGDSIVESENDRMADELKGKIKSLKEVSLEIGAEVRSQTSLFHEMDDEFDNAGGFLGKAMSRVKKLSKNNQSYIVVYLIAFSLVIFLLIWIMTKFSS